MAARKSRTADITCTTLSRRNGAWPWRPGKDAVGVGNSSSPGESQWSLAVAARKSSSARRRGRSALKSQWSLAVAARKSGAGDFGAAAGFVSQWSLAVAARKRGRPERAPRRCCGRNGAWPWRPGKATWLGTGRIGRCRRNGAWPWRPGKGGFRRPWRSVSESRNGAWPWRPGKAVTEGGWEIEFLVAMEPGRGGQEKKRPARTRQEPPMSQWSLAVAARKSRITK